MKRYYDTGKHWIMNVKKLYSGRVGDGRYLNNLYEIRDYERKDMLKKRKKILCKLNNENYMWLTRKQLKENAIFINTQWSKYDPEPYGVWGYEKHASLDENNITYVGNKAIIG